MVHYTCISMMSLAAMHILLQGCVEVLCGSHEVDTTLRDRWNRTALDVATQECKELLLNKGQRSTRYMHYS